VGVGYGQPRSPLPTDPIPLAPFDALLPAIVVGFVACCDFFDSCF